jgi:hypothetical protein
MIKTSPGPADYTVIDPTKNSVVKSSFNFKLGFGGIKMPMS